MSHSIAVTGSTGRLGSKVAARLADAGVPQTLLVRDPERAPELPNTSIREMEYVDTTSVTRALQGISTVFMVSGAESPTRLTEHRSFVDGAVAAGVRNLVYTSFYGASAHCVFTLGRDHWATEQYLEQTGLAVTLLRDNLYADFLPMMTGADGLIRGPAADGRLSAVAQDDIADVATLVLTDPESHAGRRYDMTGPEALSLAEIAGTVSRITGREVSYRAETIEEAYESRSGYGAPRWQVDAWVSTYTAIAAGEMDGVSDVIPHLLGRPATSLTDLLMR